MYYSYVPQHKIKVMSTVSLSYSTLVPTLPVIVRMCCLANGDLMVTIIVILLYLFW